MWLRCTPFAGAHKGRPYGFAPPPFAGAHEGRPYGFAPPPFAGAHKGRPYGFAPPPFAGAHKGRPYGRGSHSRSSLLIIYCTTERGVASMRRTIILSLSSISGTLGPMSLTQRSLSYTAS